MDLSWLYSQSGQLGAVAGKAILMYVTALVALRMGERRMLAQWTIIDFATAVAMGAIIVTLVVVHRLASLLRFRPLLGKLADHRIRVLAAHGELRRDQLRWCGLTDNDIYAQLRQRGIFELSQVRYLLYEAKGDLTVVPEDGPPGVPDLARRGIDDSVGWTEPVEHRPPGP